MLHELEEGIKSGDLVWFNGGPRPELGVFLKLKTFDEKYTCAMVYLHGIKKIRPIQSNLLTKVINENR